MECGTTKTRNTDEADRGGYRRVAYAYLHYEDEGENDRGHRSLQEVGRAPAMEGRVDKPKLSDLAHE